MYVAANGLLSDQIEVNNQPVVNHWLQFNHQLEHDDRRYQGGFWVELHIGLASLH
jgi:hypothetical protein